MSERSDAAKTKGEKAETKAKIKIIRLTQSKRGFIQAAN
jgi:hypothetical protein